MIKIMAKMIRMNLLWWLLDTKQTKTAKMKMRKCHLKSKPVKIEEMRMTMKVGEITYLTSTRTCR